MVYKQTIDADALSGVIAMPSIFRNKRVEVIIREVPELNPMPQTDLANIEHMMSGSITQSLIGIVPNSDRSLDDYRAEWLSKYESLD